MLNYYSPQLYQEALSLMIVGIVRIVNKDLRKTALRVVSKMGLLKLVRPYWSHIIGGSARFIPGPSG